MRIIFAWVVSFILLGTTLYGQYPRAPEKLRYERLTADLRSGQYAAAIRFIDEMLKTEQSDDLKNARAIFGGAPNMAIRRKPAGFKCDVSNAGVRLPVLVNGKNVSWLLDTGANVSMISDAEALRLGFVIRSSGAKATDLAGGSTSARTAIARRIRIGGTELQDVLFLVFPADQMPWKDWSPGQQGALGLPVAIALETLRWTRDGMCSTDSVAAQKRGITTIPNLHYEGTQVIVGARVAEKSLDFVLDTGNQGGTQLWEKFGTEFKALVEERGHKGSERVTQIGGSTDREVTILPRLELTVGGKEVLLPEGKLFSKPVGNDRFYGLLGTDILSQASEVFLDLHSMSLSLR